MGVAPNLLHLAYLPHNMPHHLQQVLKALLTLYDLLTLRQALMISRQRSLVLLLLLVCGVYMLVGVSSRFGELNRQVTSLSADLHSYKLLVAQEGGGLQQKIAREVLQGLGPAVVSPSVEKDQNQQEEDIRGWKRRGQRASRRPNTPRGAVTPPPTRPPRPAPPKPYPYLLNPRSLCADVTDLAYVIYVHSSPDHVMRRQTLRLTWARPNLFPDLPSRLVFILGATEDSTLQAEVEKEFEQHGDIIQEDFQDHNHNLTYKGIAALKWISTHCSHTKYVIKADDDAFINIFIARDLLFNKYRDKTRLIMCLVWENMHILRPKAVRDPCFKWCINDGVLPGKKYYPKYCSGAAFFLTGDLVQEMYQATMEVPYFWVDDVYVMGLLTRRLEGLTWASEADRYVYKQASFREHYLKAQGHRDIKSMVTLVGEDGEMRDLWGLVLKTLSSTHKQILGKERYMELLEENGIR